LSIAPSGVSISGPKYGLVAALLTAPSTRPNRAIAAANSASTSSALPVWQATARTSPLAGQLGGGAIQIGLLARGDRDLGAGVEAGAGDGLRRCRGCRR
jgi:hypothetical protein